MKCLTCIECRFHEIIEDPDPFDNFCYDDVAVVCTKVTNPDKDLNSEYLSSHSSFKSITRSCRPHHILDETTPPDWCPYNYT